MIRGAKRATVPTPPAGSVTLFPCTDGGWKSKDEAGTVTDLTAANPGIGGDYSYKNKSTLQSETTDQYTTYDTLNINNTSGAAKYYEVICNFTWSINSTSKFFKAQLILGSTPFGKEIYEQSPDSGDEQKISGTFVEIISVPTGAHTISLQFAASDAATTVKIKEVHNKGHEDWSVI